MPTYLDTRIDALRGFGSYGASARTRLAGEKWQKQHDAEAARRQVDTRLEEAAAANAAAAREAAARRGVSAMKMEAMHSQNLAASQAETKAARDRAKAALNPWRQAGVDALGRIQEKIEAGPGDFEGDPGYQFRLEEGQKAIERSAAARGGVLSGRAVKEAERYGQDYASNEYDKFIDRYYKSFEPLERLSNSGQSAAGRMGEYDTQAAQSLADQGFRSTVEKASAVQYGGEAEAGGIQQASDILAAQQKERAERDYGYAAWKAGDEF